MLIIWIYFLFFLQLLYLGQAAKCSRIALGHRLDATSGQEPAEAEQEHTEAGHECKGGAWTGHPGRHICAPLLRICALFLSRIASQHPNLRIIVLICLLLLY